MVCSPIATRESHQLLAPVLILRHHLYIQETRRVYGSTCNPNWLWTCHEHPWATVKRWRPPSSPDWQADDLYTTLAYICTMTIKIARTRLESSATYPGTVFIPFYTLRSHSTIKAFCVARCHRVLKSNQHVWLLTNLSARSTNHRPMLSKAHKIFLTCTECWSEVVSQLGQVPVVDITMVRQVTNTHS